MIPYLRLDAALPGGTASGMSPEALDDAIGHIPGWSALLDPDYRIGGGVLNRASGGLLTPPTPWGASHDGALPNGKPAFKISGTTANRLIADADINSDAWTVFFLLNVTTVSPSGSRDLIAPENLAGAGIGLRISLRTTGQLSIYPTAATTPRLTVAASAIPLATTFLLMCTGSTRDGLRVFVKGVLVAHDDTKDEALNDQIEAGQYFFYRNNSGTGALLASLTGLLGVDLGQVENAGYRRAIERVLMAHVGAA